MPTIKVEGAELSYETKGSGPFLLLIAGAGGTGDVFKYIVEPLSANFTVVTYDRRGCSQSILTGEQDYSQRLERDADDAAELVKHLSSDTNTTSTPPRVFAMGSSAGAIVAMTMLIRHPTLFTKVMLHEPPLLHSLSTPTEPSPYLAMTREYYDIYRAKGLHPALQKFFVDFLTPDDASGLMVGGADPRSNPYATANMTYWMERELLFYPFTKVPYEDLKREEVMQRLIIAHSGSWLQYPAARAAAKVAENLGLSRESGKLATFAGGHVGYLTHPQDFAVSLKEAFGV